MRLKMRIYQYCEQMLRVFMRKMLIPISPKLSNTWEDVTRFHTLQL